MRRSDVVVVCLSRDSITKEGYVQKEIKVALDIAEEKPAGTIFVIPGRLEDVEVPQRLKDLHWVNLFEAEGYQKLLAALDLKSTQLGTPRRPLKKQRDARQGGRREFHRTTNNESFLPNAPEVERSVDGRRLRFTGLTKVFYPGDGYTKRDIINFYAVVADLILPHLHARPLSLKRYPNGIDAEFSFQKNVPANVPEWLHTRQIPTSDKEPLRMAVADSKASLLYLANFGCIEQHPWMSRVTSLHNPDFILVDLDPYFAGFDRVIEAAYAIRETLDLIGLLGYPKTTGGGGMHIYIPIEPHYTYAQSRDLAELLASCVSTERPDLFTTARAVAAREKGKIYFDWLQNAEGKTISAPYVVRAFPGAPVATPLHWDEILPD